MLEEPYQNLARRKMTDTFPQIKVAAVQATPILFDREATVEKTCRLTAEAAAQGAQLLSISTHYVLSLLCTCGIL